MLPRITPGPWLFAFVFLVYLGCPPMLSYDSYWTLATAISLAGQGTTEVDEFVPSAPARAYGLECVPESGHCYNLYPVGTSLLAAPVVSAIGWAVRIFGPLMPRTGPLFSQPAVQAFFSGNLMRGRPLTELACASLIGAFTVWVMFRIAWLYLAAGPAALLALLFAFGTSEWSVGSRNLMQHGCTLLLLSGALYFFLTAQTQRPRLWAAGALLALAFAVRPSNAISCVVLGLYTAVHLRRHLAGFLAGALPVAVAFFVYQVATKHSWVPHYIRIAIMPMPIGEGALMHLLSPSRGLLIFTPVVMVSFAGAWLAWNRNWCRPLVGWLAMIPVLHFLLICGAWPGHGYGPRLTTDTMHLAIFFLIPAVLFWQTLRGPARGALAAGFLVLALWGVFVHARGAASIRANQWSALPQDVDTARWRVWDWHDPQFLRGLR
jgi:hypothetical protein